MISIINRYAALRPLLIIVVGILVAYYLSIDPYFWLIPAVLLIFIALALHLKAQKIKWIETSGILLLVSLGLISAYRYSSFAPVPKDVFEAPAKEFYKGNISKVIKSTPELVRVELQLDSPQTTIITYLAGVNRSPEPGDQIIFKGDINPIQKPLNPGQFDTKKYYGYRKIYGQIYLQKGSFVISPSSKYPVRKLFYRMSSFVKQKIISFIPDKTASALIQGVLLGIRHDLDPELMKIFAHAGIMHILSVSGMHAAILYGGILYFIRKRAERKPKLRLIPVVGVWLFALLTGAGPAVLRAALIVTLTDSGNIFKKQVNSLNLLLSSAILLLILQPYLIWDIGFQLSYAAMLGIILTYKAFSGLVYFKNKYLRQYIWEPTALSVSAQIFTTAPALYYFGIFPTSFILTNIVTLIPVTLMLFGSILMVFVGSFIPIAGKLIGTALTWLIKYLFLLPLDWMHKIPYSYFEYLHFSFAQLILLTLAMCLLTYWILNPRKTKVFLSGLSFLILVFALGFIEKHFLPSTQPEIIVYNIPKKSVIGLPHNHKIQFWGDSIASKNPEEYDFFLGGSYRKYRLEPIKSQPLKHPNNYFLADSNFILTANYKIFILTPSTKIHKYPTQKLKIDYILISKHPFISANRLKSNFDFKAIILDGNISNSKRRIYRKILDEGKIPYFDTQESGALILPQNI